MGSRRTVILIVALVLGALSIFGLFNYVRGLEEAANDGSEPVPVWVVQTEVPKGTPIEQAVAQNLVASVELPGSQVPSTAISNTDDLAGLVAVVDLPQNAPLISGFFVSPNVVSTGVVDRLEEKGVSTVTLALDQVKGAAYMAEPGDFVNVISVKPASADAPAPAEGEPPPPSGSDVLYENQVRYIYQRAEVLAVDQSLSPELGESSNADEVPADETSARNDGLITLAMPPTEVQTVLAVGSDNIYLSLVPPSAEVEAIPPVDLGETVAPGEDSERLTPFGPSGGVDDDGGRE